MKLLYCISFLDYDDFNSSIANLSYFNCIIDEYNQILEFETNTNRDSFLDILEDIEIEDYDVFEVETWEQI